jgi:hypothetical protein
MLHYSSDFDKRDIIESTLMQSNKEKGRCLSKTKVMESLKFLQDAQLLAYKEAITDEHDNSERLRLKGTDEAEERF